LGEECFNEQTYRPKAKSRTPNRGLPPLLNKKSQSRPIRIATQLF
jgi:hypothetical protein